LIADMFADIDLLYSTRKPHKILCIALEQELIF